MFFSFSKIFRRSLNQCVNQQTFESVCELKIRHKILLKINFNSVRRLLGINSRSCCVHVLYR